MAELTQEATMVAAVGAENVGKLPVDVREGAKKIREKLTKEGPDEALAQAVQIQPVNEGEIKQSIAKNIYINKDPNTGAPDPSHEQGERVKKATDATVEANKYLAERYDRLPSGEQDELRNKVEAALKNSLPQMEELLGKMGSTQRKQVMERILRDPEYTALVRNFLNQAKDKTVDINIPEDLKNKLTAAEEKIKQKQKDIAKKSTELSAITTRYTSEFTKPRTPGAENKFTQLDELNRQMPTIEKELAEGEAEAAALQQEIDSYNAIREARKKTNQNSNLSPAEENEQIAKIKELGEKKAEIEKRKTQIKERERLMNEKTHLEEESERLRGEIEDLKDERDDAIREKLITKADVDSKKHTNGDAEDDFVAGFEKVWDKAMGDYLAQKFEAAEQVRQALLEEEKEEIKKNENKAQAEKEEKILTQIQTRWNEGKAGKFKNKKGVINEDFYKLVPGELVPGGPRGIMREIISDAGITDPAEIDAFIAQNPEFIKAQETRIVETVIAKKLQTGKISENEARSIAESPWGEKAIEQALAKNEKAQKQIDKLKEKGIIKSKADWLKWAALILAGVVVTGAIPLAQAGIAAAPAITGAGLLTGAKTAAGIAGVGAAGAGGYGLIDELTK